MARNSGPKNKLARKIGEDLNLKTNSLKVARRLMVRPGQHGAKSRRKLSDFGQQLKEKQKLKIMYGIMEKQMRRLYTQASRSLTSTGATLISLLERRLDNTVYRLGWAPTRAAARQFVSHGHVHINQRKMNVPSYQVKVDDLITLTDKGSKIPFIIELLKDNDIDAPEWLQKKRSLAKVMRLPIRGDVKEPIEEQFVIEYYSR